MVPKAKRTNPPDLATEIPHGLVTVISTFITGTNYPSKQIIRNGTLQLLSRKKKKMKSMRKGKKKSRKEMKKTQKLKITGLKFLLHP